VRTQERIRPTVPLPEGVGTYDGAEELVPEPCTDANDMKANSDSIAIIVDAK
jgi:hypothetical protein